jgi:hypothetical protein
VTALEQCQPRPMHSTGTEETALAIIRSSKKRDAEIGLAFDEMQPNPLLPLQDLKKNMRQAAHFYFVYTLLLAGGG